VAHTARPSDPARQPATSAAFKKDQFAGVFDVGALDPRQTRQGINQAGHQRNPGSDTVFSQAFAIASNFRSLGDLCVWG
jgi:hypothetical protein